MGGREYGAQSALLTYRSYAVAHFCPPSPSPFPHNGGKGSRILPLSPRGRAGRG
jgi:hypothetical protein